MTGWRIEQAVEDEAHTASVIGFANDYCGYWATPEEFLEQRYEGASSVFGREGVPELTKQLEGLAAAARSTG